MVCTLVSLERGGGCEGGLLYGVAGVAHGIQPRVPWQTWNCHQSNISPANINPTFPRQHQSDISSANRRTMYALALQLENAFMSSWERAAGDMTNPDASPDDLELAEVEAADAWLQLKDSTGVASGSSQAVKEATQFALSRGVSHCPSPQTSLLAV